MDWNNIQMIRQDMGTLDTRPLDFAGSPRKKKKNVRSQEHRKAPRPWKKKNTRKRNHAPPKSRCLSVRLGTVPSQGLRAQGSRMGVPKRKLNRSKINIVPKAWQDAGGLLFQCQKETERRFGNQPLVQQLTLPLLHLGERSCHFLSIGFIVPRYRQRGICAIIFRTAFKGCPHTYLDVRPSCWPWGIAPLKQGEPHPSGTPFFGGSKGHQKDN